MNVILFPKATRGLEPFSYRGVLVQIANKMGLKKTREGKLYKLFLHFSVQIINGLSKTCL
jgi:hypothetical protein